MRMHNDRQWLNPIMRVMLVFVVQFTLLLVVGYSLFGGYVIASDWVRPLAQLALLVAAFGLPFTLGALKQFKLLIPCLAAWTFAIFWFGFSHGFGDAFGNPFTGAIAWSSVYSGIVLMVFMMSLLARLGFDWLRREQAAGTNGERT